MTTANDLLKACAFAEDAPELMSAYAYDAYARMMNMHTDRDGSDSVQQLVPPKRLRVGGRFSIGNDGHGSYSFYETKHT